MKWFPVEGDFQMAKFKVRLKVTGFELEVEGSRDDVPLMTESIGQQFAGLLQPAANIVEGEIGPANGRNAPPVIDVPAKGAGKRGGSRRSKAAGTAARPAGSSEVTPLDWVHDPSKWGAPQQRWVTAQKSIWLLYVAAHEKQITTMSSALIAHTFNKHFHQAKAIQVSKVSRDLGIQKVKTDPPVSEDTTQTPPAWFLTPTGEAMARQLIQEALGQSNGNSAGEKS
jgi:hypothetical protein